MWLVTGILDSTGTRKYTCAYTLLLFYSFYVRGFFGVKFVYKTALDYVYSKNLKPCLQNYVHFLPMLCSEPWEFLSSKQRAVWLVFGQIRTLLANASAYMCCLPRVPVGTVRTTLCCPPWPSTPLTRAKSTWVLWRLFSPCRPLVGPHYCSSPSPSGKAAHNRFYPCD